MLEEKLSGFSAKKALDLVDFIEMQYPDNSTRQIVGLIQALCMVAVKSGRVLDATLKAIVKSVATFPGWTVGWETTRKLYDEEAKEEASHAH